MMSEAAIQQQIRLEAARRGTPLLRNNNGACLDDTGRMVRFGLGNDSAKISRAFKSSDLIGIWPVVVTPEMVGRTLGVFMAVEVKRPGAPKDDRYRAQENFGRWVEQHGGFFRFATRIEDVWG